MSQESGFPAPDIFTQNAKSFRSTVHFEKNIEINHVPNYPVRNIDYFYWALADFQTVFSVDVNLNHPATELGSQASVAVQLRGVASAFKSVTNFVQVTFQDQLVGSESTPNGAPNPLESKPSLDMSKALVHGLNTLRVQVGTPDDPRGGALLNWFDVTYDRYYLAADNYLEFHPPPHVRPGPVNFRLEGFSSGVVKVYKIGVSSFNEVVSQKDRQKDSTYTIIFHDVVDGPDTRYVALTPDQFIYPNIDEDKIGSFQPADHMAYRAPVKRLLRDPTRQADYLMISLDRLMDTAQELVDYRSSPEGGSFSVALVNAEQIYEEFADGNPTPYAIKDFIRYAYESWSSPAPEYLLMVGDGNPSPQEPPSARSSRFLLPTVLEPVTRFGAVASDNAYVLLSGDDILPEMYVGRFPAQTKTDLEIMIKKTIDRERSYESGPWLGRFLMVAGEERIFRSQLDIIAKSKLPRDYWIDRIFIEPDTVEFPEKDPFTPEFPNIKLKNRLEDGATIVAFVGHGGARVWLDGRVSLQGKRIPILGASNPGPPGIETSGTLPIILSMTCFTGDFLSLGTFDPVGDLMMRQGGQSLAQGAVAWWGASSFGWVENDYALLQSTMDILLQRADGPQRLGPLLTDAKIDYVASTSQPIYQHSMVHSYNLLGDPALQFQLPRRQMSLSVQPESTSQGTPANIVVKGSLPVAGSGTAYVMLHDDRGVPLTPQDQPLTVDFQNGKFETTITVPGTVVRTQVIVRVYANTSSDGGLWIGSAAVAVAGTLIDSVNAELVDGKLSLSALIVDNEGIAGANTIFSYSRSLTDTVTMIPDGDGRIYRTSTPFDLSTLTPQDQITVLRFSIEATSNDNRVTLRDNLPPLYPFRNSKLVVRTLRTAGRERLELVAEISNSGSIASDSVTVLFSQVGHPPFASVTIPSVPAAKNPIDLGEDTVLRGLAGKTTRTSIVRSGAIELAVVTVPDSAIGSFGSLYRATIRATDSSVEFPLDASYANITPTLSSSVTLLSDDSNFSLTMPPSSVVEGATRVAVRRLTEPPESVQPDIGPLLWGPLPEFRVYEVEFMADVQLNPNAGAWASIVVDTTAISSAEGQLRLGYYDPETKLWEVLQTPEGAALDTTQVSGLSKKTGIYALVHTTDVTPPRIELTAANQLFSDGAFVSKNSQFLATIEDANGVSGSHDGIVVWLDGVALPDSLVAIPAQQPEATSLPVMFWPPLADDATTTDHVLRVEATDLAGNLQSEEVTFKVGSTDGSVMNFWGNFPNPFADKTVFAYTLQASAQEISFRIYSVSGKLVLAFNNFDTSQLYPEDDPALHRHPVSVDDDYGYDMVFPGYHEVTWGALTNRGAELANGVYFGILTVRTNEGGAARRKIFERTFKIVRAR